MIICVVRTSILWHHISYLRTYFSVFRLSFFLIWTTLLRHHCDANQRLVCPISCPIYIYMDDAILQHHYDVIHKLIFTFFLLYDMMTSLWHLKKTIFAIIVSYERHCELLKRQVIRYHLCWMDYAISGSFTYAEVIYYYIHWIFVIKK